MCIRDRAKAEQHFKIERDGQQHNGAPEGLPEIRIADGFLIIERADPLPQRIGAGQVIGRKAGVKREQQRHHHHDGKQDDRWQQQHQPLGQFWAGHLLSVMGGKEGRRFVAPPRLA